jgi:hypothetical protein
MEPRFWTPLTGAGGGRDVVFVGAPATVAAALNWCSAKFPYTFLASSAIAKNTLIAIEAGAFASAFMPVPEFAISAEALIHQDTTPLEIVSATGPTTANPVRSLWQTNSLAMKTILRCSWGMRSPGLVQQIASVTW